MGMIGEEVGNLEGVGVVWVDELHLFVVVVNRGIKGAFGVHAESVTRGGARRLSVRRERRSGDIIDEDRDGRGLEDS